MSLDGPHDKTDGVHDLPPLVALLLQLTTTFRRERVIARATIVLRGRPAGLDPPAILETVQRGIQGPLLHLEKRLGPLLDRPRDGVSVCGAELQRLQDQHVERPLQKVSAGRPRSFFECHPRLHQSVWWSVARRLDNASSLFINCD
jgi:hypothetical protein